MEDPQAKIAQNTFKFTFKISDRKAINGISSLALLACVFVYISIFYIFDLSPRVLVNTSKFWFFISNTLILIIAADSGAFSSSKNNINPYPNFQAFEIPNKYNNIVVQANEKSNTLRNEPIITTIVKEIEESKKKTQENTIQECTVVEDKGIIEITNPTKNEEEVANRVKSCQRSKSDKVIRIDDGGDENDNIGLHRSLSEKRDEPRNVVDEDNDRFSSMSDEELNKRVEEFIRRFYSQQKIKPQRRREVGQMY